MIQIMKKARDIISVPSKWTKNLMAANSQGLEVMIGRPDAVTHCLVGACREAAHQFTDLVLVKEALRLLLQPCKQE